MGSSYGKALVASPCSLRLIRYALFAKSLGITSSANPLGLASWATLDELWLMSYA
jgi:hypothetical protein